MQNIWFDKTINVQNTKKHPYLLLNFWHYHTTSCYSIPVNCWNSCLILFQPVVNGYRYNIMIVSLFSVYWFNAQKIQEEKKLTFELIFEFIYLYRENSVRISFTFTAIVTYSLKNSRLYKDFDIYCFMTFYKRRSVQQSQTKQNCKTNRSMLVQD